MHSLDQVTHKQIKVRNLGKPLSFSAAPLIGLAVLAAIAGSTNTGATVVPGATTILRQVPRVCPVCPTM
jgi:hypothetical protein